MTSRIVFESWQMFFPAIGFTIFAVVFGIVVARVWRMKTPTLERMNHLPLADDERAGPAHRGAAGRVAVVAAGPEFSRNTSHVRHEQNQHAR